MMFDIILRPKHWPKSCCICSSFFWAICLNTQYSGNTLHVSSSPKTPAIVKCIFLVTFKHGSYLLLDIIHTSFQSHISEILRSTYLYIIYHFLVKGEILLEIDKNIFFVIRPLTFTQFQMLYAKDTSF